MQGTNTINIRFGRFSERPEAKNGCAGEGLQQTTRPDQADNYTVCCFLKFDTVR
jgi:hypothetical protein